VSARDRILGRVRETLARRQTVDHPGGFGGWRPAGGADAPVDRFEALFSLAGGETARVADLAEAVGWIGRFAADFPTMTVGRGVPASARPDLPEVDPKDAGLGISLARGAVAETGSVLLDARDGRRSQLLAPTHVVLVRATDVHATLVEALASMKDDLPSAVGLHSGPSKSADIGQVMVKGVHGPGRVIALLVDRME
jgi:L-lactate dehydrogenase complex protein LldG